MATAIVTDGSSGMSPAEGEELGITVIPIPILIDGRPFTEGEDGFCARSLYAALRAGKRAGTSQPSPLAVRQCWEGLLSRGYDHVIHMPIARRLSSSYDMACALAADMGGRVSVVDDGRISIALREAALKAKRMADGGCPPEEIVARLNAMGGKCRIFVAVGTLEYLARGGRIGAVTATLGNILNIKPVVQIVEGRLTVVSRQRGTIKSREDIFARLRAEFAAFSSLDRADMTMGVAGTDLPESEREALMARLLREFPCKKVYYNELPACVACHVGPGAAGIGFCFD